jgi:predicted HTH domain antitoxin
MLAVEVPEELITLLGSAEQAAAKAQQALVLELLREARISQGRAAELLGLSRWEMLEVMARHHIEAGPLSDAELRRDIEAARRASLETAGSLGGGRQQQ